jgi:ribose transport system substrate-binding protein
MMRKSTTVIACLGVALTAFGCGSSGSDGGGSTSASTAQGANGELAYFDAQLATLFKGTHEPPPSTAPKPEPGKNVWLISCGQSASTCAYVMDAAQEAAGLMGWKTTVFDSKGDPAVAATGIRQAIAAKADGIYVYYQDCSALKQPLIEAERAGIPVVASESFDCDFKNPGEKPLYADSVAYVQGSNEAWGRAYGAAVADYLIAKKRGKANSLLFMDDTTALGGPLLEGFKAEFDRCSACEYHVVEFPITAIGTDLQQRAEQALLKYPDVNSIGVEYDAILVSGVGAAAKASGRDLLVMAGEGGPAVIAQVRSGDADGGIGDPNDWGGWAAMDSLNRLFHDEEPQPSGVGVQAYDAENNLPSGADETFKVSVDFKDAYKKAWGVR